LIKILTEAIPFFEGLRRDDSLDDVLLSPAISHFDHFLHDVVAVLVLDHGEQRVIDLVVLGDDLLYDLLPLASVTISETLLYSITKN
jgi:hypothetical protein